MINFKEQKTLDNQVVRVHVASDWRLYPMPIYNLCFELLQNVVIESGPAKNVQNIRLIHNFQCQLERRLLLLV